MSGGRVIEGPRSGGADAPVLEFIAYGDYKFPPTVRVAFEEVEATATGASAQAQAQAQAQIRSGTRSRSRSVKSLQSRRAQWLAKLLARGARHLLQVA